MIYFFDESGDWVDEGGGLVVKTSTRLPKSLKASEVLWKSCGQGVKTIAETYVP
jgi:hypothetical protein